MSTLAERVTEAIDESGVKVAEIAQKCGITPQSVYDWKKGASLEIEGSNLVILAKLTGYNALWIARGEGPRRGLDRDQAYVVGKMESMDAKARKHVVKAVEAIYDVELDTTTPAKTPR